MNLFGDGDYLEKLSLNSKVANRVYSVGFVSYLWYNRFISRQ